jgi:hypothetical protein
MARAGMTLTVIGGLRKRTSTCEVVAIS